MSVRKNSVKLGVAAVAVAGLVMTVAAPAGALDAGPSTAPKLGTDIIGVGSDTTQWVMDKLTTDYDAAVTTGPRLINYDACVGNTNQATPPAWATTQTDPGSRAGRTRPAPRPAYLVRRPSSILLPLPRRSWQTARVRHGPCYVHRRTRCSTMWRSPGPRAQRARLTSLPVRSRFRSRWTSSSRS